MTGVWCFNTKANWKIMEAEEIKQKPSFCSVGVYVEQWASKHMDPNGELFNIIIWAKSHAFSSSRYIEIFTPRSLSTLIDPHLVCQNDVCWNAKNHKTSPHFSHWNLSWVRHKCLQLIMRCWVDFVWIFDGVVWLEKKASKKERDKHWFVEWMLRNQFVQMRSY